MLLAAPLPIPAPAHRLAAILLMMVILWITEALPLAVTALIGPVLAIILQVAPARVVFAHTEIKLRNVVMFRKRAEAIRKRLRAGKPAPEVLKLG